MRLGPTLADWRDALRGDGPAVSSRVWPAGLRAAFPGPRRALEAWEGEGAAFARYATGHGPLFLKYLPAGWRDGRAYRRLAREEAYLRDFAPRSPVPHAPLLHAALDPDGLRAHLVTRDLTDATTGWGAFGTDAEREAALLEVARLLARHHAFWLDHSGLTGEWGWDAGRAVRHARRVAADPDPGWAPAEVEAVREAARLLPALLGATRGVTLAHGDLHAGQVLWPREGGPPILIDYGQAHGSVLGEDLAHLIHVRLDAPDRARLGPALREAYRAELTAHGQPRTPAQLEDEERAGLALNVLATARQARRSGGDGVREALGRVVGAWAQETTPRERRSS
ncbi:phosphotransferase family protein [Deinococcus aestuarii]|uniref:phosphotransferase family protein n=1 Tax=Deinococcus aestuarii TaxID=2774531 RepID=UPI001FEB450B|nr:aminoglycoside phosphotransferase family protein [Deinococcus aestuarii]